MPFPSFPSASPPHVLCCTNNQPTSHAHSSIHTYTYTTSLIYENWKKGRRRHIWVSTSTDLRLDAARDLTDVVGSHLIPVLELASDYGPMPKEGVVFLTYSLLASSAQGGNGKRSRFEQVRSSIFSGFVHLPTIHMMRIKPTKPSTKPTHIVQTDQPTNQARFPFLATTLIKQTKTNTSGGQLGDQPGEGAVRGGVALRRVPPREGPARRGGGAEPGGAGACVCVCMSM